MDGVGQTGRFADVSMSAHLTPIHKLIRPSDRVALRSAGRSITYSELDAAANQLAHVLLGLGAGRDVPVALCLHRSPAMVVAMLAVLRAGAAYLPLDPQHPGRRLDLILRDAQPPIAILDSFGRKALTGLNWSEKLRVVDIDTPDARLAAAPLTTPHVDVVPDDLAYILYTSGSTGDPKGVAQTHRAIANMFEWMIAEQGLDPADRWLFKSPATFDMSVPEVFFPLASGAVAVIAPHDSHRDPAAVAELLIAEQVNVVQFVPTVLEAFLDEPSAASCVSLRRVLSAGEPLHRQLVDRFYSELPDAALFNLYGPTETFYATSFRCRKDDRRDPPIGRPIADTRAYVLDRHGVSVPPGRVGELWIGGAGVARGYINRPALTAERFTADLFDHRPGQRMYSTGDLVRRLPDGELEYLGRSDEQLKINGQRIEPAEIESAIRAHPAVKQAAVVTDELPGRHRRLVGYLVTDGTAAVDSIVTDVRQQLPPAFVPAAWVTLEALPLTPNGKLDRRALPAPAEGPEYEPPRSGTEATVATLFEDVLRSRAGSGWRAGRFTDFFASGGESLAATRLVTRLAAAGLGEHSPEVVFDHPTPAALAAEVERSARGANGMADEGIRRLPESAAAAGTALAASAGQSRLWFLHQQDRALTAYHLPLLWRLRGDLDVGALTFALNSLIRRHPTLRTSFSTVSGELLQVIHPPWKVALRQEEATCRDKAEVVDRWWKQESADPFDLSKGRLLRARLARIRPGEHLLLIDHHHIASDGWSMTLLARELALSYNAFRAGRPVLEPSPTTSYVEYAQWQRHRLDGDRLRALLSYWTGQLEGLEPLEIPTDRPRGLAATYSGDSVDITVQRALFEPFEKLCRDEGATLQMGLVAALGVLLGRYSRQEDLAVGVPSFGRDHPDLEDVIGFFANTLPIRTKAKGELSFRELLRQVRATSLSAYQHAELPFDRMVALKSDWPESARNRLVQVVVQVDDHVAAQSLNLDDIMAEQLFPAELTARFELEFFFRRSADESLNARIGYTTDLFDRARIERLGSHLIELLKALVERPDTELATLQLVPGHELDRIGQWQQGSEIDSAELCVHQLFSAQVVRSPEAVAVVCDGREISYRELDERANRLAHRLIELGVARDTIVAVSLRRSVDLIIALLAILKSGGAYLPLDPQWPTARTRAALSEIGPPRFIVNDDVCESGWAETARLVDPTDPRLSAYPLDSPDSDGDDARQLAYVNFTSGSTGEPKGVMIEHRGILRLLDPSVPWRIGPGDRMLQMAPAAFDAATLEIWLPLLSGATLVLAPDGELELQEIAELIAKQRISALWLTAGLFHALMEFRPDTLAGVRRLLAGGDVLDWDAVQEVLLLMPPDHMLINGYGPTESTTFATYHAMPGGSVLPDRGGIPIGRPLPGTTVQVLDPVGLPCPVGVPGELLIGGTGLARGYLNAPELTAVKFTANQGGPGGRVYRTGDLVSWQDTGELAFHGRIDDQVKIRGHRVDVGEVATTLAEHPSVGRAVVVPSRRGPHGDPMIVAYWTPRPGRQATAAELRAFLADRLPSAMIPSSFVGVERIPLNSNGKLDRDALPAPFIDDETTAPTTPTEHRLHAIWAETLGHSRFGTTDNFFMVGGHSLQTVRLHARINEEFRANFPLSLLIGSPTIRQQAQWLSGTITTSVHPRLVTIQPAGERAPLIAVPGWGGTLYHFVDIARELAPSRPVLGLQPAGVDDLAATGGVEAMAADYADSIISAVPEGPIHLVGHSAGGWYAFAVAAALVERGRTIGLLAVFDSHAEGAKIHLAVRLRILPLRLPQRLAETRNRLRRLILGTGRVAWLQGRIRARVRRRVTGVNHETDPYVALSQRFQPPRLPVVVDLLGPEKTMPLLRLTWRRYALLGVRCHPMLETHDDFARPGNAAPLARALEGALAAAEERHPRSSPAGTYISAQRSRRSRLGGW